MLLSLGAASCAGASHAVDREAEAYVRLVLALGDRDPDSLDFYAGPPAWQADARAARTTLPDIKRQATALDDEIARTRSVTPDDAARRTFLRGQLRAVGARVDLLTGRHFTFDEEAALLFGVIAGPPAGDATSDPREELARLLPGDDTVARRYAAFDRRFLIAPESVPAVIARAIDECRRITASRLTLPPGEQVTVAYVHGTPWSAFTRYEGHGRSRVEINADFALTVDRALSLACHEAYPGHHTISLLVEAAHPYPEFRVQPLFSPQTLRAEGAATFAPELAFSNEERLRIERDRLFPLAGLAAADAELYLRVSSLVDRLRPAQLAIAREYLDGTLEFARAAAALEERALMSFPDAMLKFFNQFRTYALTYTRGRDNIVADVERAPDRWNAYEHWVTDVR